MYSIVPSHVLPHDVFEEKVQRLLSILSASDFKQCIVFSNNRDRCVVNSGPFSVRCWLASLVKLLFIML